MSGGGGHMSVGNGTGVKPCRHQTPVNMSGKYFNIVPYGVNDEGFIDYEQMREIALKAKPRMIIAGASAPTAAPASTWQFSPRMA